MLNRTIQTVLSDLEAAIVDSNVDLDSKPSSVRPSFGMRKNAAATEVPHLKNEYKSKALSNVIFLFTVGDAAAQAEFADLAEQEVGIVAVDADEPYWKLVERIERTLGNNREFSVNQLVVLNDVIEDLMKGSGTSLQISSRALTSLESTPTHQGLFLYVKNLVETVHGSALVDFYLAERIAEKALNNRFSGKTLGVVVLNSTAKAANTIVTIATAHKIVLIDVTTEKVTKEFVVATLKGAAPKKVNKSKDSLSTSTEPVTNQ